MKHLLLTGMLAATMVASATPVGEAVSAKVNVAERTLKASKSARSMKRISNDVIAAKRDGIKHIINNPLAKERLAAPVSKGALKSETKDGYILYENFGGWDGEDWYWVPEGWTVEHKGEGTVDDGWLPQGPNMWFPAAVDGDYYYGVLFGEVPQDEWLISPEVELGENMVLSYWMTLSPFWFYNSDNIDWNTSQYIGGQEIICNFQVLLQEEGGEWITLRDYAEEYLGYSPDELRLMDTNQFSKQSVSLAAYSGKKVKVAFRYVGCDGNTIFLDAVGIGMPELQNVSYMNPTNTLFWGLTSDGNMTYLTADYAMYPVYSPLTWYNTSEDEATYTWRYCDPATGEFVTSDDQYELEVTYVPDYTSASSLKNNLFYPPTLTASAPGASDGSYTAPYACFQAGGKAAVSTSDGGELNFSLLPFGVNADDLTRISVMDYEMGAMSIPVFGYNEFTDQYWLNYSLDGEQPMEGNFAHLLGIGNLFWASYDAPTVVNGITVYGWGKMADDVELTATIYALDEDMHTDFNTFTVVAQAHITGAQVIAAEDKDSKDYLTLPFTFETPVAVQATDEHPVFVIMFEGFHNEKVEYFAPLQSATPVSGMDLGYQLTQINLNGHVEKDTYYSFKRMVFQAEGEYIYPGGSFAIGLDAEYPWLTAEAENIVLGSDAEAVEVALGSYYDGSKLTVEAPEGLTATVAGRYNNCVLTVSRDADMEAPVEGTIVVKGPGVEVSLPVQADTMTGVAEINADADVKAVYDLSGRQVSAAEAGGVYIVKYSDGTVRKVTVK